MIGIERATPRLSAASEVVVTIQQARRCGETASAKRLSNELIALLLPILKKGARRYLRSAGSLSLDDLLQVASIEAFKCIDRFDASRGQTFEQWCYWRVKCAIEEQLRLHSSDVHVSEHDSRGRSKRSKRTGFAASVSLVSRDSPGKSPEGDDCSRSLSKGMSKLQGAEHIDASLSSEPATPEQLFQSEEDKQRIVIALRTLPRLDREIVQRFYGIGHEEEESVRHISEVLHIPRARCDGVLKRSVALLRTVLED
jgi:RNA polymerase sigma factor for flagellar operon FliA